MAKSSKNKSGVVGADKSGGIPLLNWIKGFLLLSLGFAALILGVWVSVDNPQQVTLVLLGFSLPGIALGVMVTAILLFGAVLGFLFSLAPTLKLTNENLSLKRKLRRRDKELQRLRKAPLTD